MDIKSEIEIKMEELVPDYDFSQDYQVTIYTVKWGKINHKGQN